MEEGRRLSNVLSSLIRNGVRGLACAILVMAIRDWRGQSGDARSFVRKLDAELRGMEGVGTWPEYRKLVHECGGYFGTVRRELQVFWASEWGTYLRDEFGLGRVEIEEIAYSPEFQRPLDLDMVDKEPHASLVGTRPE